MSFPLLLSIGVSTLCAYKFLYGLWEVNFTPGPRPMFSPLSPLGAILPANALNPSNVWFWIRRQTAYFNRTHDIIAFVPWFLGNPSYYTSSLDIMKQLLNAESKIHLEKPQDLTLARLWGHSVTSANGEVWRRHRRVVSPAFNGRTYSDVWRTVGVVYEEMLSAEGWDEKESVTFDAINPLILKFTLTIICRCGFGFPATWSKSDQSFTKLPNALRLVSETLIPRIVLPNWAYRLPINGLRRMNDAWMTVAQAISSLIDKRKADNLDPDSAELLPTDILNCLVTSWVNGDKHGLSENDIANMFSLMFAGHETTASGLVTTLAYLSLYPAEQEKACREISSALSENDPSEQIDQTKLSFTLCCFWEGQRLCPSAAFIPRQLTEEFTINVNRPKQETMVLKPGSLIMFDLVGIFRNPDTFPEPEIFRPGRWTDVSEHDVGAFGFGPRACIGRKFAQTEALAFLASFLHDWKVEPSLLPGETPSEYENRVMGDAGLNGTAFGLKRVPLKLSRRNA